MSSTVRYAIVGAGSIAQSYALAFQNTRGSELVAVCDLDAEASRLLASRTNTRSYVSIEKMVQENGFDAVIVCTPPSTHREVSLFFLERGIHVLCEKPITIDRVSLDNMMDAAKKSGVVLSMASKFRYVKDVIRAKQMLELGLLGDVVLFENCFISPVDMSTRWNSNVKISGGGVLIDNGTHSVDIMRYLLGPIQSIRVVEGKRINGLSVDESAYAVVRGTNGILGKIQLSWSLKTNKTSYIDIHGSHGCINVGWKELSYTLYSANECVTFGPGYDKVVAFSNQLDNFTDTISGRGESLISEQDIIASVEVIEAAYRSLASGSWETIGSTANSPIMRASEAALSKALAFVAPHSA